VAVRLLRSSEAYATRTVFLVGGIRPRRPHGGSGRGRPRGGEEVVRQVRPRGELLRDECGEAIEDARAVRGRPTGSGRVYV